VQPRLSFSWPNDFGADAWWAVPPLELQCFAGISYVVPKERLLINAIAKIWDDYSNMCFGTWHLAFGSFWLRVQPKDFLAEFSQAPNQGGFRRSWKSGGNFGNSHDRCGPTMTLRNHPALILAFEFNIFFAIQLDFVILAFEERQRVPRCLISCRIFRLRIHFLLLANFGLGNFHLA